MSFNKRLEQTVLDKYKNFSQFAEDIGLSNSLIRAYLRGESEPKLSSCLMLANFLKVSPAWLAYGSSEYELENAIEEDIIDLINIIHERIDVWLEDRDKELLPEKKSILVKIIYKQLKDQENLSTEKLTEKINAAISILDVA
jgi:transcriptional regulator with XRE-family HTH domain